MESQDVAFEADVDLDVAAQEQGRRSQNQGERSAEVAKGGLRFRSRDRAGEEDQDADEASPLLPRDGDGEPSSWDSDFAHLPWYKRPSIYWVLGPFFLMALAFGGSMTPKVNLILDLICQEYIAQRAINEPGFVMIPVDFVNGDNDQCRIPEVQSRVSIFLLYGSLIAGTLAAITSPELGALSDRYGRKVILVFTSVGTLASEIITIFAALYPQTFPVGLLLLGFALDGLTGSFILSMAMASSYATDCTPAALRNVAFGFFHGCLFTGLAAGPILAGLLVKYTGKIVLVFYILLGVHTFFVLFIGLCVPESLSKRRQIEAREKHAKAVAELGPAADWIHSLQQLNLMAPLKVFWPTGPGSSPALRRNLLVLAAVDTILFGVAMGSMTVVVIYVNYQFGWKTYEASRFLSIVNSSRVFCLIVILPILTRFVRGKIDPKAKNKGCDTFDLTLIRVAILFDTLGYAGYVISQQGGAFIASGVLASLGGIGSPTLQSALTKHVPAHQTGQLLGANSLLHALARIVAPTIFNAIYSATVGKFAQTVFVCLASTFSLAFLISWFLRPHVFFAEDDGEAAAEESTPPAPSTDAESARIPIVTSVLAASASVLVSLGLRS
ncbi:hypothetical protein Tdes44962_MAKER00418 [Teratosphaeria destructans]|uniref:Major facilitator superfamily (MFS) profile domain-containing protein n=1 Tax=Teratosphaeria destructans TaxID=418781 RepID=A0A9W7W2B8_9PEZI|nr:hypothetical protein Tdes44962_MAKER00418 [Teratosphaeria destructans]